MRQFFITLLGFISKRVRFVSTNRAENVSFQPIMSIEKLIDKQIQDAMARSDFDNLEGKGKPLNLDAYFATPEEVRVGYSVLKSNKFVPEEVDRLKEIGELKETLKASTDEAEKERLNKTLIDRSLALSIVLERNKRRS